MEIVFSKSAIKFINSMDKPTKQRIKNGIIGLTEVPPKGDIKTLQGNIGTYRLRIGKYRIIYEFKCNENNNVLTILDVGSRGEIYK